MIVDSIKNLQQYIKTDVFEIINSSLSLINKDQITGEFELVGQDLFYRVFEYETKACESYPESHEKYIDIQIVLSGEEKIRWFDSNSVIVKSVYNIDTDCAFYETNAKDVLCEIILKEGYFCLFYPQEVHQAQITTSKGSKLIKKMVYKVSNKYFKSVK